MMLSHQSSSFYVLLYMAFFTLFGYGVSLPQGYNYPYRQSAYTQQRPIQVQRYQTTQPPRNSYATATTTRAPTKKHRISKSDAENGKFLGAYNQEDDGGKTLNHIKRKRNRYNRPSLHTNPCYFRSADSMPKEQGRFLWDINVYNVYQRPPVVGCGGVGGYDDYISGATGGFAGGNNIFADDIAPIRRPNVNNGFFQNLLSLLAPGVIQNAQRPPQFDDLGPTGNDVAGNDPGVQNDAEVDPDVGDNNLIRPTNTQPVPVLYNSPGAQPLSASQLVGGVSSTVNEIIQQLTGNSRPVYQRSYRSPNVFRTDRTSANRFRNEYLNKYYR